MSVDLYNLEEMNNCYAVPIEIWLHILQHLAHNELKLFRLVSKTFDSYATHTLQKLSHHLLLSTTEQLESFLLLMRNTSSGINFFSKFQISYTSVTSEALDVFANEIGKYVKKYRLPEPKEFNSVEHKNEAFHVSYAKCLTTLLNNAPKLESLKLLAFDYRVPQSVEIRLSQDFPNLKKIWIRLEFRFSSGEGSIFISKLIRRSPRLEKLFLHHSFRSTGLETTDQNFLDELSKYGKLIPAGCKLGLLLSDVDDSFKNTLEYLISSELQLCFLWIRGYNFENSEIFELFLNWVTKQPISKLYLDLDSMKITEGIRLSSKLFPIPFHYCQNLRLYGSLQHDDFNFPNVRKVHLRIGTADTFSRLAIAVPLLERLSCKSIENPWNTLISGITTLQEAMEIYSGIKTVQENEIQSPLNNFRRLKNLDLDADKEGLLVIFFLSSFGLLKKLDFLILRVPDKNNLQDTTHYENLLCKYHPNVYITSKAFRSPFWWHSY